jgi:hypothetical protein
MNMLSIHDPKISITPTGIQFNEELSFDEWDALGQKLAPIARSIGFILGDWINYGEERYGAKYDEALKRTGLTYSTLSEYSYVARRVEFCARAQNLDYSIHRIVAKLKDPDEQKHWLAIAEEHNLSVRRLRKSINFGRLATEEEVQGDPADKGVITHLALINRLIRWWKQTTADDPVDQWDEEQRENVKKDFKLILDIYEAL